MADAIAPPPMNPICTSEGSDILTLARRRRAWWRDRAVGWGERSAVDVYTQSSTESIHAGPRR
jgi:hypothetical protein